MASLVYEREIGDGATYKFSPRWCDLTCVYSFSEVYIYKEDFRHCHSTTNMSPSTKKKQKKQAYHCIKVPITPKKFFRLDETLSHVEQNGAKIFGFGQNRNFL